MYNTEDVLKDFDRLNSLYLNSNDIEEKNDIYKQMKFLYVIDKKTAKERFSKIEKPKEIIDTDINSELNRFNEIKKLTFELCNNADVLLFNGYASSKVMNKRISEPEYYNLILNFFKDVMPNDLEKAKKAINENLVLSKNLFFRQAYIMYLDNIKNYYINIVSKFGLRNSDARNTVHELGHAFVYENNGTYNSNDPILTESIAYLYELLYLYDFIEKNNCNKEKELGYFLYTSLGNRMIYDYLEGYTGIANEYDYLMALRALYGNLIATTMILNNDKNNLLKKIDIIKNNYNDIDGFNVLDKVDIHEEDLIYTSKHLKELVKKRLI